MAGWGCRSLHSLRGCVCGVRVAVTVSYGSQWKGIIDDADGSDAIPQAPPAEPSSQDATAWSWWVAASFH